MSGLPARSPSAPGQPRTVRRVGCVSYLNARPLIEGLEESPDPLVRFDVPSRLLDDLLAGDVDVALCPVIDYYRSPVPLELLAAGGIGCQGPTLTVRLFSRVPIEAITAVHADTDSHTSVALLRVLLAERHGLRPRIIDYHARERVAHGRLVESPETMLLIGDKVVTDSPAESDYPHHEDLGEAWHAMTGLPFVFAAWMCRAGAELGDAPEVLDRQRLANAPRVQEIAERRGPLHGWPVDLAKLYLGQLLRYELDATALAGIERFAELAHGHALIERRRPLRLRMP